MFGRNLTETVKYEARKTGGFIPVIVERCVEFIREKGLSGVFVYWLNANMLAFGAFHSY